MSENKQVKVDCCPLLKDVISRPKDTDKLGLMLDKEMLTGREFLLIRMRKAKKGTSEHWNAVFAEVSYCPFCGKKIERTDGG